MRVLPVDNVILGAKSNTETDGRFRSADSGALNGEMTPTTPTGSRRARLICGLGVGRIEPSGREASAAASKHSPAATCTWKPAIPAAAPPSRRSQPVISCSWASSRSPARRMTAAKREQALRRSARQLAVEAFQIGASSDLVFKIVQEELEALQGVETVESTVKLSVVGKSKP